MAYPNSIDSFSTYIDDVDNIVADTVNNMHAPIVNIETALGTNPQGSATDLKTRLAASMNDDGSIKASTINHQNLTGAGTNTHAQVDSHISNTSNPHSVTASQVNLGNVTNNAQLKIASNLSDVQSTTTSRINLGIKSGIVAGALFAGNPKKYTVTFVNAYADTNYSITITGGANRTFTYESKAADSFIINANANLAFTEEVSWICVQTGG